MRDKIDITCPRCKHKWEQFLDELPRIETIYRGDEEKQERKVEKYRAVCPNDGTYVIIEIEEDGNG